MPESTHESISQAAAPMRPALANTTATQPRHKNHTLLLVLDEFPQLGRMPTFETQMAAMAGYGMKAFIVCQSFNHITRAYGRDNVILDNCHIVTAFSAADMETAKRIADMAGEAWEMRPQVSEQRPRAVLGARKGSVTYREERRPLMLPGDVRKLPRDEQLIFIAGSKPLRTRKLRFDRLPLFAQRLRPASKTPAALSVQHDWMDVAPFGRLKKEIKAPRGSARAQPDLFADMSPPQRSPNASAPESSPPVHREPEPMTATPATSSAPAAPSAPPPPSQRIGI
jgi:type IV secretion system protein VirD4